MFYLSVHGTILLFSFVLLCSAVGGSLTNVSSSNSLQGTMTPTRVQTSRWTKAEKDMKVLPQRGQQTKVNRKGKRVSQASNASNSDSPDSNRNSLDNAIELSEQACIVVFSFVALFFNFNQGFQLYMQQ